MTTSNSTLSILLFTTLVFLLSPSQSSTINPKCDEPESESTLKVYHVNSPCSPFRPQKQVSWEESVLQMQSEDTTRLLYLSNLVAGKSVIPVASGRALLQTPTYIVRTKVGTPPQTFLMAVDNNNDVAWLPCSGCTGCAAATFATEKSTSFKPLGCKASQCKQVAHPTPCTATTCGFNTTYGSSTIAATLSQDSLKLAKDVIPRYTFGCIQKTTGSSVPPQGLLGLGLGRLSLLSQTQTLYKSTFSYCLPSFKSPNFSGDLRLGPVGQPIKTKFTQLLQNPVRPSLYYINLAFIKVGRKIIDLPFSALAYNPANGAGTIIDTGTVFTRLVEPAYIAVRDEFRRQMGKHAVVSSLGGFDTCYSVPITVRTITFMFKGVNETTTVDNNMILTQDNFIIHSSSGSLSCLAMAASPNNVNSVLNVIASMQQQNFRVVYDVPNSRVSVLRETCT